MTVTPSAITSGAMVLSQACRALRQAFEYASSGIGWRTPDDMIATIRPQPRRRIPGRSSVASSIGVIARSWNERRHSAVSVAVASDAGGPPALRTTMSTCPSAFSASAATRAAVSGSEASPEIVVTSTE